MVKRVDFLDNFLVFNSSIIPVKGFSYSYPQDCKVLYEVVRVKNSIPIFFEEHIDRLWKSIELSGFSLPDRAVLTKMFIDLLKVNPVLENNVRISLVFSQVSEPDLLIHFIPSTYPSKKQEIEGVCVKTIHACRENPNIKVENKDLRAKADEVIKKTGCYEVILVGNDGLIAEGSRSNLFFIKDNVLITPPIGMVLGGITRQMVINLGLKLNIEVKEEIVSIDRLQELHSAFITGTSPGILPIKSIDDYVLDVNSSTVKSLINSYDHLLKDDIKGFKSKFKL